MLNKIIQYLYHYYYSFIYIKCRIKLLDIYIADTSVPLMEKLHVIYVAWVDYTNNFSNIIWL